MMILTLMFEFFKTGLFSIGGGLATLPFLYEISTNHPDWFTHSDIADMVAISESTPGPIGINMSTYAGYSVAGIPGGILASLALALPSIIITLIIARFLAKFRQSKIVEGAFYGLRPASIAMTPWPSSTSRKSPWSAWMRLPPAPVSGSSSSGRQSSSARSSSSPRKG